MTAAARLMVGITLLTVPTIVFDGLTVSVARRATVPPFQE